jgi:hypothetical protein
VAVEEHLGFFPQLIASWPTTYTWSGWGAAEKAIKSSRLKSLPLIQPRNIRQRSKENFARSFEQFAFSQGKRRTPADMQSFDYQSLIMHSQSLVCRLLCRIQPLATGIRQKAAGEEKIMHSMISDSFLERTELPLPSSEPNPVFTEDILLSLRGRIALVGNGTPLRPFGKLIDSYDVVIRFNNYRINGFEDRIGTRTDFRCTTGWDDVEQREGVLEFSPFCADSAESANLPAFNKGLKRPVLTAKTDIHPLIPESAKPSAGLSLIQLFQFLGLKADLFGFDGFRTPHYWTQTATPTTHSPSELEIILSRPNVVLITSAPGQEP